MTSALRRLFDEIIAEADRRPDFGKRLTAALREPARTPPRNDSSRPDRGAKRLRRNRRAPGVLDPFEQFSQGEQSLRQALQALNVDQLKDIVSEHAMDSSKLALKWHSAERLVDLIVSTVRARLEKGDAFKRDFVASKGD